MRCNRDSAIVGGWQPQKMAIKPWQRLSGVTDKEMEIPGMQVENGSGASGSICGRIDNDLAICKCLELLTSFSKLQQEEAVKNSDGYHNSVANAPTILCNQQERA